MFLAAYILQCVTQNPNINDMIIIYRNINNIPSKILARNEFY